MSYLNALKQKYIGSRFFYISCIKLAVPMILQSAISNFVSLLDNIMVGQLGTEQMTGVAIVNQFYFVYSIIVFGVTAAGGIYGAQYYGKGDYKGHMYTFRFRLYAEILISMTAILLFLNAGKPLINTFLTKSAEGIDIGLTYTYAQEYLHIILLGLIPFAVTQAYASAIKETGQTFVPMLASVASVIINAVLDWLLIFGVGPFPMIGVTGAAAATVIARFVESAVVVAWAHTHVQDNRYLREAYRGFGLPANMLSKIVAQGTPLMLNEMLWASGMTALTQSYSARGVDIVAALNIANTINNLFNIVYIQLGVCISIMVGQYLGAGQLKEAKDADNKLIFFSVSCCIVIATVMFTAGEIFPRLYNTTDGIKTLASSFIRVQALVTPFCAFSNCAYFTLRSGGKTIITFLFDSVFAWVVMIPTAYLLTNYTGIGIATVFFFVTFTELIKDVVGYFMVKSNVWLVQIV